MGVRRVCLALLLTAACDGGGRATTVAPAERAAAPAAKSDPRLAATLGEWIGKDWSSFRAARDERCDDARFHDLPAEARTLVLAVRDARYEKKNLLPLDLTGALTEPKLHALRDELSLLPGGRAPSEALEEEIRALDGRRFAGVFHVTEHYAAERVFRMDRGRWEWVPGTLVAWLAVHDKDSGAALCQTLVVVKNDTRSVPVTARQKSFARERLTRELGRDVRAEAGRALRRISAVLELPGRQPARVAER